MKKGFTLIELLIVIAIIGILAVSLLPSILSAPQAARDAGKKAKINDIVIALESFNAATGKYPSAVAATGDCLTADTGVGLQLAPYFKSGKTPLVDANAQVASTLDANTPMGVACSNYYYCNFANNRYYVGVILEAPMNVAKGGWTMGAGVKLTTQCGATPSPVPVTFVDNTLATKTYGALQ